MSDKDQGNGIGTVVKVSDDTSPTVNEESWELTLDPNNAAASALGEIAPTFTSIGMSLVEAATFDSFSPEAVNKGTAGEGNLRYVLNVKKTASNPNVYEITGRDDDFVGKIKADNAKEFESSLGTVLAQKYGEWNVGKDNIDASTVAEINDALGAGGANINSGILDENGQPKVIAGSLDKLSKVIGEVNQRVQQQAYDFLSKLTGFGAQNFFMENVVPFVDKAKNESRGTGYGNNIKLVSTENAAEIMHIMTSQKGGMQALQQGTALDYSLIYPQIKIFMELDDGTEVKIPFATHMNHFTPDSFLKSREGRADDVGILELGWNYWSGDSGTFVRSDGGELYLKLYFQTAESIFKKRKLKKDVNFNFSEFLGVNNGTKKNQDEVYNPESGRIRIVVGYDHDPQASKHGTNKLFFKAAKSAKKAFLCTPAREYDLDVQEDGSMVVTFHYEFSSSSALKDNTFDIFDRRKIAQLEKEIQDIKKAIELQEGAFGSATLAPPEALPAPESAPQIDDCIHWV